MNKIEHLQVHVETPRVVFAWRLSKSCSHGDSQSRVLTEATRVVVPWRHLEWCSHGDSEI